MKPTATRNNVSILLLAMIFGISFLFFFLTMSREPNTYDEGLIVAGAMRVYAGQVPHRDFYANYGPAQFYLLAGLFKVFGSSLLVERIYDVLAKCALATLIFSIAASFCRRRLAFGIYCISVLWIFGIGYIFGSPIPEVCFLSLLSIFLVLPHITGRLSNKRLILSGMLTGLSTLFRYDSGAALTFVLIVVLCAAAFIADLPFFGRARLFGRSLILYLLGIITITLPPVIYFVSVAPIRTFVHDLVQYPSMYYARARSLPFPAVDIYHISYLAIYCTPVIALLSIFISLTGNGFPKLRLSSVASNLKSDKRSMALFGFGLLTLVMYFKGWVRVSTVHMFLGIVPSVLVVALLYEYSLKSTTVLRACSNMLLILTALSGLNAALLEARRVILGHTWMLPEPPRSPFQKAWCQDNSELTRGICFLPDDDRIRAITYLKTHIPQDQTLFVANTRNDIVFANDNIMYFAVGRLPATHWSHFDPDLQNTLPIQTEMVHELDSYQPPYIVLDAEFNSSHEPNDSSRSTGVTLLDDYIHHHYVQAAKFGDFTIARRLTF